MRERLSAPLALKGLFAQTWSDLVNKHRNLLPSCLHRVVSPQAGLPVHTPLPSRDGGVINGHAELPGLGQQVISITAGFSVIRGSDVMAERGGPAVLSQLKYNNNRTSKREKTIHVFDQTLQVWHLSVRTFVFCKVFLNEMLFCNLCLTQNIKIHITQARMQTSSWKLVHVCPKQAVLFIYYTAINQQHVLDSLGSWVPKGGLWIKVTRK